jgi:hypothetical protein
VVKSKNKLNVNVNLNSAFFIFIVLKIAANLDYYSKIAGKAG